MDGDKEVDSSRCVMKDKDDLSRVRSPKLSTGMSNDYNVNVFFLFRIRLFIRVAPERLRNLKKVVNVNDSIMTDESLRRVKVICRNRINICFEKRGRTF